MKYIVAVSGGVDSVVLLDMVARLKKHELVVAHFDHGIRSDSAADARFVAGLAKRYGVLFETERKKLGASASEDAARRHRYAFLANVLKRNGGRLMTAHHQDDVIETIIINLLRGTGWRGLAVLNHPSIDRPLLKFTKAQLYAYALKHGLEWVEDETNASDAYLRNRIRRRTARFKEHERRELIKLFEKQRELAKHIDAQADHLLTTSRHFMTMIDEAVAIELLRAQLAQTGQSLTRPQRLRLLHAIKTAKPGDMFQAGSGVNVTFTKREFIVKYPL